MTAEQKKQLRTLAILLVVMVGVGVYEYETNFATPSSGPVPAAEKVAKVASALPAVNDARIRQDLIGESDSQKVVGRRNVFQYYVPPPPPKPVPPITIQPPARPPQTINPGPTNPPPPTVPFSALTTFSFDGVGIVAKPGKLVASIFDKSNHYYVSEGDYILGRYRVNKVTETSVEIEDMDQGRRQVYTRVTTI